MSLYSRYILSPLIDCACGCKMMAAQRAQIIPQATGTVLELGAGSGHNFQFYDPTRVTKVVAIEPEPALVERAAKAAKQSQTPIELHTCTAEELTLPAGSIDTIVVTYVMCTIPDAVNALRVAKTALKPTGKLIFCEHGIAPDVGVARTQARIEPIWKRILGGCHLTRDIPNLIQQAGFNIANINKAYLPEAPRFAGFQYIGTATPT